MKESLFVAKGICILVVGYEGVAMCSEMSRYSVGGCEGVVKGGYEGVAICSKRHRYSVIGYEGVAKGGYEGVAVL